MASVLTEIMSLIGGGVTALAGSIGAGLNDMAVAVFVTGEGTSSSPYALSTFGGIIAIFAGIALAVGLTTLVTKWIMSLGARK